MSEMWQKEQERKIMYRIDEIIFFWKYNDNEYQYRVRLRRVMPVSVVYVFGFCFFR